MSPKMPKTIKSDAHHEDVWNYQRAVMLAQATRIAPPLLACRVPHHQIAACAGPEFRFFVMCELRLKSLVLCEWTASPAASCVPAIEFHCTLQYNRESNFNLLFISLRSNDSLSTRARSKLVVRLASRPALLGSAPASARHWHGRRDRLAQAPTRHCARRQAARGPRLRHRRKGCAGPHPGLRTFTLELERKEG
jgi:hypothetical protein